MLLMYLPQLLHCLSLLQSMTIGFMLLTPRQLPEHVLDKSAEEDYHCP